MPYRTGKFDLMAQFTKPHFPLFDDECKALQGNMFPRLFSGREFEVNWGRVLAPADCFPVQSVRLLAKCQSF